MRITEHLFGRFFLTFMLSSWMYFFFFFFTHYVYVKWKTNKQTNVSLTWTVVISCFLFKKWGEHFCFLLNSGLVYLTLQWLQRRKCHYILLWKHKYYTCEGLLQYVSYAYCAFWCTKVECGFLHYILLLWRKSNAVHLDIYYMVDSL